MFTIKDILPEHVQSIIDEYNTNQRMNAFLASNEDCNKLITKITNTDRFQFVMRCNQIERELIPFAVKLNNRPVRILGIGDRTGFIRHEAKRIYEGRELSNDVSFRSPVSSEPATLALWVEMDDKYSSHLYTIDKLVLID